MPYTISRHASGNTLINLYNDDIRELDNFAIIFILYRQQHLLFIPRGVLFLEPPLPPHRVEW